MGNWVSRHVMPAACCWLGKGGEAHVTPDTSSQSWKASQECLPGAGWGLEQVEHFHSCNRKGMCLPLPRKKNLSSFPWGSSFTMSHQFLLEAGEVHRKDHSAFQAGRSHVIHFWNPTCSSSPNTFLFKFRKQNYIYLTIAPSLLSFYRIVNFINT